MLHIISLSAFISIVQWAEQQQSNCIMYNYFCCYHTFTAADDLFPPLLFIQQLCYNSFTRWFQVRLYSGVCEQCGVDGEQEPQFSLLISLHPEKHVLQCMLLLLMFPGWKRSAQASVECAHMSWEPFTLRRRIPIPCFVGVVCLFYATRQLDKSNTLTRTTQFAPPEGQLCLSVCPQLHTSVELPRFFFFFFFFLVAVNFALRSVLLLKGIFLHLLFCDLKQVFWVFFSLSMSGWVATNQRLGAV